MRGAVGDRGDRGRQIEKEPVSVSCATCSAAAGSFCPLSAAAPAAAAVSLVGATPGVAVSLSLFAAAALQPW